MNIYETVCKVMEDVGTLGKNKRNTSGQPFMYRGVDDLMNALNPAMVENRLFIVPEVLEQIREDRLSNNGNKLIYSVCRIKYTFYASDGTNVSAIVVGEAFDSGDKATNKAMSVAFKYACFQVFCIPTEEMKDPDADRPEDDKPSPGKSKQSKHPQSKPPQTEGTQVSADAEYKCESCGTPFTSFVWKDKQYKAKDGYEIAKKKCNGKALCNECKKGVTQ